MKSQFSPNRFSHFVARLAVALFVVGFSVPAAAEDGLLVLVTEQISDGTGETSSFWWAAGPTPTWTATDNALRTALNVAGAGFVEPKDVSSLSKIFRRATPSPANATAMATVFGRTRVLVGTVRYERTALQPLNLSGWRAIVSTQLVEKGSNGPTTLRTIEFERTRWASSADEAREGLRTEVADAVAAGAAGGLIRRAGPVGVASDELRIGVQAPSSRRAIEALRTKLQSLAGVTGVQEVWAAEGIIVLEVNPGAEDPRTSIEQYVSLLVNEGAGNWSVRAVKSAWPNVVALQVEERTP